MLIDPTGGLNSLVERKLETVGDADKRFGEDALRLVRALRIVNICNQKLLEKAERNKRQGQKAELFDFSSPTWESIKKNASLLPHVAKERVKDELCKVFRKGDPF